MCSPCMGHAAARGAAPPAWEPIGSAVEQASSTGAQERRRASTAAQGSGQYHRLALCHDKRPTPGQGALSARPARLRAKSRLVEDLADTQLDSAIFETLTGLHEEERRTHPYRVQWPSDRLERVVKSGLATVVIGPLDETLLPLSSRRR
jgi:hypothetical protein